MTTKNFVSVTPLQTSWSESDDIKSNVYYMRNKFILKNSGVFKTKRKYI